jgi:transcription initiation factor IIE alpha subunit
MVKNKQVKRIIEDAIDRCGGVKMQGVKSHLLKALREASEVEKKEEKKKSAMPAQGWKFDISTGKLKNMTREQMNNALGNIERMIEEESGSGKAD